MCVATRPGLIEYESLRRYAIPIFLGGLRCVLCVCAPAVSFSSRRRLFCAHKCYFRLTIPGHTRCQPLHPRNRYLHAYYPHDAHNFSIHLQRVCVRIQSCTCCVKSPENSPDSRSRCHVMMLPSCVCMCACECVHVCVCVCMRA